MVTKRKPPTPPPPVPVVRRVTLDLAARDAATLANLERITGDTAANVLRTALREYATELSREGVT